MFFYDFGFGELIRTIDTYDGKIRKNSTFALHTSCAIEVIWRDGSKHIDVFLEDTSCDKLNSVMERLVGVPIKRVDLSEKNDLWLDLGVCWIVIATNDDGEESWRFFDPNSDKPHLIASNELLARSEEFYKKQEGTKKTGDGSLS